MSRYNSTYPVGKDINIYPNEAEFRTFHTWFDGEPPKSVITETSCLVPLRYIFRAHFNKAWSSSWSVQRPTTTIQQLSSPAAHELLLTRHRSPVGCGAQPVECLLAEFCLSNWPSGCHVRDVWCLFKAFPETETVFRSYSPTARPKRWPSLLFTTLLSCTLRSGNFPTVPGVPLS